MDWFQALDIPYYLLLIFWFIQSRRIIEVKRELARIQAQLNSIIFVQSGQLNGASGPEILAKMQEMGKRFEEELKFMEIAEKARPPWWRRALIRTPRINNKGEENDSGGTAV